MILEARKMILFIDETAKLAFPVLLITSKTFAKATWD